MFSYDYGEIGAILDRNEAACRQLVSRARSRLRDARPRFDVDPSHHERLLRQFIAACSSGELDGIVSLLTDDVVLLTDGGADVRAARFPIRGRDRVARLLVRVLGRRLHWMEMRYTQVNGSTGFMLLSNDGDVVSVGSIDVRDDRIAEIDWVINPDKLAWITPP